MELSSIMLKKKKKKESQQRPGPKYNTFKSYLWKYNKNKSVCYNYEHEVTYLGSNRVNIFGIKPFFFLNSAHDIHFTSLFFLSITGRGGREGNVTF